MGNLSTTLFAQLTYNFCAQEACVDSKERHKRTLLRELGPPAGIVRTLLANHLNWDADRLFHASIRLALPFSNNCRPETVLSRLTGAGPIRLIASLQSTRWFARSHQLTSSTMLCDCRKFECDGQYMFRCLARSGNNSSSGRVVTPSLNTGSYAVHSYIEYHWRTDITCICRTKLQITTCRCSQCKLSLGLQRSTSQISSR